MDIFNIPSWVSFGHFYFFEINRKSATGNSVMFMLLHWYCHRGLGCGKMMKFTFKIFNNFGDVYTRDGTISVCQRDASALIVIVARLSKSIATLTLGSSKINQHCWRFHGSGVIAALQIIGLISCCTGMYHEYFFRSSMCFRVPHLCSKIPKINNWSIDSGVHSVCLRGDFAIKTVVRFLR